MATTHDTHDIPMDLVELLAEFLADYYREDVARLAQSYPNDQQSLHVDYQDLYQFGQPVDWADLAHDTIHNHDLMCEALSEALVRVDLPADIDLSGAHVLVHNLPDHQTSYPGAFSPSDREGEYYAVRGEVVKATDVYSRMVSATFKCQRCHHETAVPQTDDDWQEPHECPGCERQGPFQIVYDESEFIDGQKLRVQTPPEEAQGDGQDIDAYVEGELTDIVTVGDRVTLSGIVELDQQFHGSTPTNKFEPYVSGRHIQVEQTDAEDVDISPEERERIHALANGEEGDPLELAAESLAPKIHGYDTEKRAIILALVGGSRVEYEGEDFDRGEFHVLLIGDPSTAKSKLVERAEQVGWRSVGVSGTGATVAGVTATAVQDDFGDGSWTLDAGAAVKAHRGVLAVDELDDMPAEVRSALLEPMSKQTIHITKGGINTHLQTRTAVIAAANPEYDRFDPYEPIGEQFTFSSTLLSRFDLAFTFRDEPDEQEDAEIAGHILQARDAAKRIERDQAVDESEDPRPPVASELLRSWIALAKQQPKPVFADGGVRESVRSSFTDLRGMHDYDDDAPVPVTFRSLEGIVRIAEAAAKFEFSETIEERHVDIATSLVGQSMRDVGMDPETEEYDADMVETGTSKSQRDRVKNLTDLLEQLQAEYDSAVPVNVILDRAEEEGLSRSKAKHELDKLKEKGELYEPAGEDGIRFVGGA